MDETSRSADRTGDPCQRAVALRRRGEHDAALRVVRDAARAGSAYALELLEVWDPLDSTLERLHAILARLADRQHAWQALALVGELAGACDPRLDPLLREVAREHGDGVGPGAAASWTALQSALQDADVVARLHALLRDGASTRALHRAWLWPAEAEALASMCQEPRDPPFFAQGLAGIVLRLLGRFGAGPVAHPHLREAKNSPSARVRLTARQALHALGEAPPPPVLAGLPATPAWAAVHTTGAWRDGLTECWTRRLLFRHWSRDDADWLDPPPADLPFATPDHWVLLLDIDGLKRVNDRFGFFHGDRALEAVAGALPAVVGDRAFRYSGQEFIVVWEGEDGPAVAEALRAQVAALNFAIQGEPVPLSVSVSGTRGGPAPDTLRRVDQAMELARADGQRGRVCVLD